ncbi:LRR_1 domain-containing protein/Pkinase_Tyr domain-containing protein/LRRNT_2 domain-containing protein [Cephalotus follicularis]|uniref:non-specific serine/threonine protein kinase n=1 Tax=Cephalotus follicularis TaxID=3775 RepID=A0A1Q3D6F6_CEPFO|nr:LRR_1 domain-containing protein/Pkinase_Tyr domain-containing protein/LRRNT_2 domain-containing protein [Cephalotus follicularis]
MKKGITNMFGITTWGYVLAVSYCYFILLAEAQITHRSEVSALQAVKRNLIDPGQCLRNWNNGDPCTSNWTGIVCADTIGTDGYLHVVEIQLLNKNFSGVLAPELGLLSHLEILDFMWNDLTGSIPKEIGNISSLVILLLNGNRLSGKLPDELGNLSNLNRLQVDENNISGPLPISFANLSSMRHLHLNNNSISGQIPHELSSISTLLHLLVDNNNLSGYLPPELSNLPQLRILQLDNNNFNGSEIPASYENFSTLAKLSLRNCSLRGAIPDFSRIENLHYLDLSWNRLTETIPSNKLSDRITTITGRLFQTIESLPKSANLLPLSNKPGSSLEDNLLTGSFPANLWQNMLFNTNSRFTIDLRNNSLSSISGNLNPPKNVTLRLGGNPICNNANIPNIGQFCGSAGGNENATNSTNTSMTCPVQACPVNSFFEYVPASPAPCFCASPIRIGYRLKSPSFSYFPPYIYSFEIYVTSTLNLDLYQLSIASYAWEKGPRLRMYLKLFPAFDGYSSTFNRSEVQRIRHIFSTWKFPGSDLYGPYELLNFTLLGPYSNMDFGTEKVIISKGIFAAIIVGIMASDLAISGTVMLLIARRQARHQQTLSKKRLFSKISMNIDGVKDFSFKEMVFATNNFDSSTQVGQGGYGKVYKGILFDNTVVAIKRAEEGSLQGQTEFLTEIMLLSRLHHRNLVSLFGYCYEEGEQMLVYEFMPNGTLRNWISARAEEKLNFGMRLQIALGSAKGILYLHTEANPPVFHRDIKASNILLDSKLNAKVADFGLSRLAPVMDDEGMVPNHVSTIVKGTPGYLDPEYFLTRKLTDKSDVYSLGVVFLELLTGMHPIFHGKNIVREVNMAHQSGTMFYIIDSRMGSYPSDCLERFVALALNCCKDKPEQRPSMLDVVRELENILKMMPETDLLYSDLSSMYSGNSASSSSLYVATSRDLYASLNVSGSDLVSGVVPTIRPR